MNVNRNASRRSSTLHAALRRSLVAGAILALAPLGASHTAAAALAQDDPGAWAELVDRAGRSDKLLDLLDRYTQAALENNPLSVGPTLNDRRYDDRFGNTSPAGVAAWRETQAGFLSELTALDRTGWSEDDHLDADLLIHQLELARDGAPLKPEQTPVSSISGPQYWLPQLASFVSIRNRDDLQNYVYRLEQVPVVVGDAIEQMTAGVAEGRVPPKTVIEPTVEQALAQASPAIMASPESSPFYEPFLRPDIRAMLASNNADDPSDHPLARRARELIAGDIAQAYTDLALFLQNSYLPACRETDGIAQGVDGIAAYEFAIRQHTTVPLTAEDIHQTGLDEVARIRQEMFDTIARTDWATEGMGARARFASQGDKFDAFVDYLRTDERFYFTEPEDLLDAYRALAKVADPELVNLFGSLPRLPYGVREIPLFAARHSPTAYYYPGSLDQGVPGYFMANTYRLDQRPRYTIVPLTLHEAVPGHHLQIALAQEITGQHPIRRLNSFGVFTEGWGLYAEKLGLEMGTGDRGLYSDPYDDFGRLNFEMWRAMRLVVDSGIHAFGWTEERAVEYMLANSALTEVDARSEVKRYIGWAGQALSYKIGELAILDLRADAEDRLGERFDLRAWHDHLLGAGAMPLPVLRERMDRWVSARE